MKKEQKRIHQYDDQKDAWRPESKSGGEMESAINPAASCSVEISHLVPRLIGKSRTSGRGGLQKF